MKEHTSRFIRSVMNSCSIATEIILLCVVIALLAVICISYYDDMTIQVAKSRHHWSFANIKNGVLLLCYANSQLPPIINGEQTYTTLHQGVSAFQEIEDSESSTAVTIQEDYKKIGVDLELFESELRKEASVVAKRRAWLGCWISLQSNPHYQAIIRLPLFAVIILVGIYPAYKSAARMRAIRRLRSVQCVKCGYYLRGNVSGICPECGSRVPKR